MGFHRSHEKMRLVEDKLRSALELRSVAPDKVERIVQVISSFALYGFPESHAISFGLLAYASSYLKVHRAAEFYTGLLNNQPMGFYSPATLVQEAKRRGLRFIAPSVTTAAWRCEVIDDQTVRLGLVTVKGLNENEVVGMVRQRETHPFRSLEDFRQRTNFNQGQLRQLAAVGALNDLATTRRQALWEVASPELEQGDLFAAEFHSGSAMVRECPLVEMTYPERIQADFQGLSLTVGRHPLALVRSRLDPGILTATDLGKAREGAVVSVAGAVICRQRPGTAKGVVFVTLEDETGFANSILYPDVFEAYRLTVTTEAFLVITGTVQRAEDTTHLMAERVEGLRTGAILPVAASHDFH
jgi:error-prone DNA polymerase